MVSVAVGQVTHLQAPVGQFPPGCLMKIVRDWMGKAAGARDWLGIRPGEGGRRGRAQNDKWRASCMHIVLIGKGSTCMGILAFGLGMGRFQTLRVVYKYISVCVCVCVI